MNDLIPQLKRVKYERSKNRKIECKLSFSSLFIDSSNALNKVELCERIKQCVEEGKKAANTFNETSLFLIIIYLLI